MGEYFLIGRYPVQPQIEYWPRFFGNLPYHQPEHGDHYSTYVIFNDKITVYAMIRTRNYTASNYVATTVALKGDLP